MQNSQVASELDIKVPPISFRDIEAFLEITRTYHDSHEKLSAEERIYAERNNRKYPWERRILEFNNNIIYNYKKYTVFENIISIIDQLPVHANDRHILLLHQYEQAEYDFNWHFDVENNYGFRICYNIDTDKPFLEFGKLKPEFLYVRQTLEKIQPNMLENYSRLLIPSKTNTVFTVEGMKHPHRVPVVNSKQRLVIIVKGKLKLEEFGKLKLISVIE